MTTHNKSTQSLVVGLRYSRRYCDTQLVPPGIVQGKFTTEMSGECPGDLSGGIVNRGKCPGKGLAEKCLISVQCLWVAVLICANLVNTQTHRQLATSYTISSAR